MRFRNPMLAPLVGLGLTLVGCETCEHETTGTLTRPAGEACPSHPEQVEAPAGEVVAVHSLTSSSSVPALTVCWYRLLPTEFECGPANKRSFLLSEARAFRGYVTADNDTVHGCEGDWYLLGQVLPAPLTADDPEGLIAPDPALCPSEITTGGSEPEVLDTFVGADQYPARVTCTYDVTVSGSCGESANLGFGCLK